MAGPAPSPADATPSVPDNPVVFISYAREDALFVARLSEALQLKGVLVSGDWQLVRGENYDEQLQQLQLGADVVLFVISPDSLDSVPCRVELDRAVEQRRRLIPVVWRDLGEKASAVPPAVASPQWTFLRAEDDFVAGVQAVVEAVNTDFELLPQHRRLLQGAETWQRNGRSASYLLRKDGLKRAEAWLVETGRNVQKLPKPTPLQLDYIRASQTARTRGSRIGLAVVTCIAAVLGVLAVVALLQSREARRQASIATDEAAEADRQTVIAKANRDEAERQQKEAERQRAEAEQQRDEAETATETARAARAIDLANQPGREIAALTEAVQAATSVRRNPSGPLRPVVVGSLAAAVNAATSSIPLVGHSDEVDSAAFSPDGSRVLTKSKDATAKLWDAADGRLIASLAVGPVSGLAAVSAASFSCDSRRVVTVVNRPGGDPAKSEFGAQVSDARTGAPVARLVGLKAAVLAASFSPDSSMVVMAGADRSARIWDVAARKEISAWEAPIGQVWGTVFNAAFSPDGSRLMTIHQDSQARLWQIAPPELLRNEPYGGSRLSVAFSPDSSRLVAGGHTIVSVSGKRCVYAAAEISPDGSREVDKTLHHPVMRTTDEGHALVNTFADSPEHAGDINSAGFSPDGLFIVTASQDNTARLWSVNGGAERILRGHSDRVWYAGYAADSRHVVTASADHTARIWDTRVDRAMVTLGAPRDVGASDHDSEVYSAEFSPDGTRVLTAHHDGYVRVWDAQTGRLQTSQSASGPVDHASFSSDGSRILAATEERLMLWDARSGRLVSSLPGTGTVSGSRWHQRTGFSPRGDRFFSASGQSWTVWNSLNGKSIRQGTTGEVEAAAFSPTGRAIAVTSGFGSDVLLVNVDSGRTTGMLHSGSLGNFAVFSADGLRIVTPVPTSAAEVSVADRSAQVTDTGSGKVLATFAGHGGKVLYGTFSPDGTRLVTASEDGTARIWDAATAKTLVTLEGHSGPVWYAAFSPDGQLVATVSGDAEAWLWDSHSGRRVAILAGHIGSIHSVAFSPDGRRIVTASQDGSAKVFSAVPSELATEYMAEALRLLRHTPDRRRD